MWIHSRLLFVTASLCCFLGDAGNAFAARPLITSHTPQYTAGSLVITVQWQSENPVIKAVLLAGAEQKSTKLDDENRRTPDGYYGEGVINTQMQGLSAGNVIVYSLQIEDEYRQKSEVVQGRYQVPVHSSSFGSPAVATSGDSWGAPQEGRIKNSQLQQGQAAQTGQPSTIPQLGIMQQQMLPPNQVVSPTAQSAVPLGNPQTLGGPGFAPQSSMQQPQQQPPVVNQVTPQQFVPQQIEPSGTPLQQQVPTQQVPQDVPTAQQAPSAVPTEPSSAPPPTSIPGI